MNRVTPNTFVIYRIATFDEKAVCVVYCRPKQIWECDVTGDKVTLSRKEVTITIPKLDFDKHWKVVE